jgi:hypothetical protein
MKQSNIVLSLFRTFFVSVLICSPIAANAQTDSLDAGIKALETKEYATSLRIILPLAEKGNPEAQVFLGYMYENGFGVQQDYKEAFVWYERAATKGQLTAQFNLAYLYKNGYGVAKDEKQAALWYERAAKNGFSAAQNNLGYMYEKGIGVTKNYVQAAYWYQKAADQGHKNAQINLAYLYENGLGVPKDIDRAIVYYERALLTPEKLSSADVRFAQDRLDAIRSTQIKKDMLATPQKSNLPKQDAPKKEIYSEVVVAPDLSETNISRSTAQTKTNQTSDKPSAVSSSAVVAAPVVAAAVLAPPVKNAPPVGIKQNSDKVVDTKSQVSASNSVAAEEVVVTEKELQGNVKTPASAEEKAISQKTKKTKGRDKKQDLAKGQPEAPSNQNQQAAPALATTPDAVAVVPVTPSTSVNVAAEAVPKLPEVPAPSNPDSLPLYGLDGRMGKEMFKGVLAIKSIVNSFEDIDSSFWLAKATVTIVDPYDGYKPYANGGVVVKGFFEPTGGDTSCVTDATGSCTLVSARIRTNVNAVRMKIYSVLKK